VVATRVNKNALFYVVLFSEVTVTVDSVTVTGDIEATLAAIGLLPSSSGARLLPADMSVKM
jgi:hypothetical protein